MIHKSFTIRKVGIGDGVQFTSLPENYTRTFGKKLVDLSEPWYLDHNPYVLRGVSPDDCQMPTELWNYPKIYEFPEVRNSVYMSNAEVHASVFGIENPPLIRPRLYAFEDFPFERRELILFHPYGKSHGALEQRIIDHVIKKYGPSGRLVQIGHPTDPDAGPGVPRIHTPNMWDLAGLISTASMLIGVDSGPSWIAACYPDVVVKKVRMRFQYGYCEPKDWVPMDVKNPHSFWDDRMFQIFNAFEDDVGFTRSYKGI